MKKKKKKKKRFGNPLKQKAYKIKDFKITNQTETKLEQDDVYSSKCKESSINNQNYTIEGVNFTCCHTRQTTVILGYTLLDGDKEEPDPICPLQECVVFYINSVPDDFPNKDIFDLHGGSDLGYVTIFNAGGEVYFSHPCYCSGIYNGFSERIFNKLLEIAREKCKCKSFNSGNVLEKALKNGYQIDKANKSTVNISKGDKRYEFSSEFGYYVRANFTALDYFLDHEEQCDTSRVFQVVQEARQ